MPSDSVSNRPQQIVTQYLEVLDQHLSDLRLGKTERSLQIKDLADLLCIHPVHLSNTIHEVLGLSPCDVYEARLMEMAREMLRNSTASVAEIARTLQFDPSNFNKFFRHFEGITPGQYRSQHRQTRPSVIS